VRQAKALILERRSPRSLRAPSASLRAGQFRTTQIDAEDAELRGERGGFCVARRLRCQPQRAFWSCAWRGTVRQAKASSSSVVLRVLSVHPPRPSAPVSFASPILQLLLASDRRPRIGRRLDENEPRATVSRRKSLGSGSMLREPSDQVIRHSDVECPRATREDVHEERPHGSMAVFLGQRSPFC
jgi:hypothetical protein